MTTKQQRQKFSDTAELLQATHDEIAAYCKRLRASDPHSASTVGGWARAIESAIRILRAEGSSHE